VPVHIRVLLPGEQVVAHLWSRRRPSDGWLYEVGLPACRNGPGGSVEPAEYRVWVRAPQHVRARGRRPVRGGVQPSTCRHPRPFRRRWGRAALPAGYWRRPVAAGPAGVSCGAQGDPGAGERLDDRGV
jgi:hypothetical protein